MNQNQIFNRTRRQLAGWYVLVTGLLLSICGVGLYQVVIYSQEYILRQKLESLSGTLHDSIEPFLEQPNQINNNVKKLLPGLCLKGQVCQLPKDVEKRHIAGVFQQEGYYLRLTTLSGQVLATIGQQPQGMNQKISIEFWQQVNSNNGESFYQISLLLRTQTGLRWGYLQIGRSMVEWNNYLMTLRLLLILGLPLAMLLVGGASWWLSRLAMRPIYESYRQMQQFTSDAAHELRTPLAVLQSTIEEMGLAKDLEEVEQNLEIMKRQNRRLSSLVTDLLLISKIDQQKFFTNIQPCCLNELILDLVEELEELALSAGVTLKTDLPINESIMMMGEPSQLYRMVSNLMTNGIQYTPSGGIINITLSCTENYILIQIQDTGIGIAPEELPRIFDRFYRVQSDRCRLTGGAGLGLSIAQAIAHAHRGRITVKSQLAQGSVFTIELPYQNFSPVLPKN
ncbi:integral membrane sensor signal transduction histidine kinase [Gloeothece citriformis PCC 7424]|uniref:histidine kinase n=1 Tax=Gloeothece citriformis (strain PCC 7424) TaxID=65393 RepID=B7KIK1_GLOC7|nr:two-component system sensor histidine kinase RppB [Gloeothece citriformis]ACK69407.1 integral membrane sensor signal transduction histidine kinase [Gloeothece citriformis PCC 7424]